MNYQKVYLNEDKSVSIKCPSCMRERQIPFEKIPARYQFKVKCSCGTKFGIQCESRLKYRKDVNLEGTYMRPNQNFKWGRTLNESVETNIKKVNCRICNISTEGVGIEVRDDVEVGNTKKGDILLVNFRLDNSASTEIEKMVSVKVIKDHYLGCEFFDKDKNDTKLKFYFL